MRRSASFALLGCDVLPMTVAAWQPGDAERSGRTQRDPDDGRSIAGAGRGGRVNQLAMNCTAGTYHGAVSDVSAPQHGLVPGESKRNVTLPALPLSQ
jgi:hypothetical protein